MRVRNVLIFPAGTEIGLEIFNALRHCKEVKLFGAGQDVSNHAKFIYEQYYTIPSICDENWLRILIGLCHSLKIDYIFPAYDDIIVALAKVRDKLPAVLIAPSESVCNITRSKSKTYSFLQHVVKVPQLFKGPKEVKQYPVFLKPDIGQGSMEVKKILNEDELISFLNKREGMIVSEYLPGEEYTVDCFSDREKGLLFCGARIRGRMRNGIAVNTKLMQLPEAYEFAIKIGEALSLYGAWFFQLKRAEDGELTLLEVAPRIAGSMAAHRVSGINFPLLCIYEHERFPVQIQVNRCAIEMDRALYNKYRHSIDFDVVYVDLDDTLILNNKVNVDIIKLIYQCINRSKKIVLITRHSGDLSRTLSTYRISGLFDQILHLSPHEKKSNYIKESTAIFVDDSFSERLEVATECGIFTFDSSMVELITNGGSNEQDC